MSSYCLASIKPLLVGPCIVSVSGFIAMLHILVLGSLTVWLPGALSFIVFPCSVHPQKVWYTDLKNKNIIDFPNKSLKPYISCICMGIDSTSSVNRSLVIYKADTILLHGYSKDRWTMYTVWIGKTQNVYKIWWGYFMKSKQQKDWKNIGG
jgi:hypothetical protein